MCVCFLAWAACSPRNFSGERVARTSSVIDTADSTALRRWLDRTLRETILQHAETALEFESVTVRERLSAPDSSGAQHVTERSTTRSRGSSVSSSGSSASREEQLSEGADSVSTAATHGEALTEEREAISGKVSGWLPWYVYALGLVGAVILGLFFAFSKKRFISCK